MRPALRFRRTTTVAAAAVLLVAPFLACAATQGPAASSTEFYRCRDARGQVQYGQSIPAACMDLDVEVVDKNGRLVRTIPGRRSLEQVEAQKAAQDDAQAAAQRDRTLLATYLSVADIERLRDQRLELLEQQSRVTRQYIANLRERATRLMSEVQPFRPYNDSPQAPPVPDHLATEMVNTVNGLQVYQEELAKNTAEQEKLRAEFGADIARFKELKGVK
jgi:hypothetical protein